MFCDQCGEPILDGSVVCRRCGFPTPAGATAPGSGAIARRKIPAGAGPRSAFTVPNGGPWRRALAVVWSPATAWPLIASEPIPPRSVYLHYVAPLSAIGVVAGLIGRVLGALWVDGRVEFAAALVHAAVFYALSFLGVFLIALVVDVLAPRFGGRRDALAALKLTAYSFTPVWIAGIFGVFPALAVLAILGALYALYLLYLGLPVLMRCGADRSAAYAIATVLCAIPTWALIAGFGACTAGTLSSIGAVALRRLAQ